MTLRRPQRNTIYPRNPKGLILSVLILFLSLGSIAQNKLPLTRILFVLDASNSMNAGWKGSTKINVARNLLSQALDSLQGSKDLQLGLRVYGHQTPVRPGNRDCDDTKLEVPFSSGNFQRIKEKIGELDPKGTTPIARSLERAAEDFPSSKRARNIIILITDGIEACDGDPCAVSRKLQEKGIVLKPFVIGIGLDKKIMERFQCVGKFYDASDKKTFKKVLKVVISQALNSTTAQVNLLNINDRPKETNIPITIYDRRSEAIKYQFIHTMNNYGRPDTLRIDPLMNYRVVAHTTPKVVNDSVGIEPGQHNIIPLKTPQGQLKLKYKNDVPDRHGVECLVRRSSGNGGGEILKVQDIREVETYLVGKYDLEFLTLPRRTIKDVNIDQNHTTTVELPEPGVAVISTGASGYGALFEKREGKMVKVTDLEQDVDRQQLNLQPGTYTIVFRPGISKKTFFTKEKEFRIKSGKTTQIDL